jgi:GTPase SAR1 family protein
LLCFSLVDPASYNNVISKWAPELKKHCPDTPILLVGTKLDCREDERSLRELARRNEHPIMNDDGLLLKKQIGAFDYIECSARTGKNLKYVFTRCIEQVIGAQLSDEQKTKRRSKNLVQKIFSKKHKCTVM